MDQEALEARGNGVGEVGIEEVLDAVGVVGGGQAHG